MIIAKPVRFIRSIDPKLYNKKYFLSKNCEGFYEYRKNNLSNIKIYELQLLELSQGDTVLDIGCGRGDVELYLSKMNINFVALDYSEAAVKLTKSRLRNCYKKNIIRADARKINIRSKKFSKILIGDVIEHMQYKEAILVINESFRLLKKNGIMVIHTAPNTWFKKYVYIPLRYLLYIIGKRNISDKLRDNVQATKKYHVDEYSIYSLNKVMKKSLFKKYKIWVKKDSIRQNSKDYLSSIKENWFIKMISSIINNSPLILIFGNDLFVKAHK